MRRNFGYFVIFAAAIVLDQVSKLAVAGNLAPYSAVNVIPGFFNLTHIYNPGGAFGFFATQSQGVRTFVFIGMAFAALGLILWFFKNTPKEFVWLRAAYSMILGGAVGNLIDRIRMGHVIDFLDVYFKDMHWPAFNIADSFITMGMAVIIFHVVFNRLPNQ